MWESVLTSFIQAKVHWMTVEITYMFFCFLFCNFYTRFLFLFILFFNVSFDYFVLLADPCAAVITGLIQSVRLYDFQAIWFTTRPLKHQLKKLDFKGEKRTFHNLKRWQFALFVSLPLQIFRLLRCSPLPNHSHALLVLMLSREMHPGTQSCLCWPAHTSMAPEDEIPVWPAAAQLLWIKGLAGHHHIPHSHTTISQHLEAAHQIFGRGCGWWITSERVSWGSSQNDA